MRIFHMADLHIGITLYNRDLAKDQKHVLTQVVAYAGQYQPDVVLIAGDVYDRSVPSAEAVALFDWFLETLVCAVPQAHILLIAGNHDSGTRIDCYRDILKRQQIYLVGSMEQDVSAHIEKITRQDEYGDVHFYLLPFVRPAWVRQILDTQLPLTYDEALHALIAREELDETARNVIVTHQFYVPDGKNGQDIERADSEIITVGNIDCVQVDALRPFAYAALGHIHKMGAVGDDRVWYAGTPMAYSVSEAGQKKGILMIELEEPGTPASVTPLYLSPLHEVRQLKGTLAELLMQQCEDYVSAVLVDEQENMTVDVREQLQRAFPNLLEIRRQPVHKQMQKDSACGQPLKDPWALLMEFMPDLTEKEQEVMEDVWNTVHGGELK